MSLKGDIARTIRKAYRAHLGMAQDVVGDKRADKSDVVRMALGEALREARMKHGVRVERLAHGRLQVKPGDREWSRRD